LHASSSGPGAFIHTYARRTGLNATPFFGFEEGSFVMRVSEPLEEARRGACRNLVARLRACPTRVKRTNDTFCPRRCSLSRFRPVSTHVPCNGARPPSWRRPSSCSALNAAGLSGLSGF